MQSLAGGYNQDSGWGLAFAEFVDADFGSGTEGSCHPPKLLSPSCEMVVVLEEFGQHTLVA